MYFYLFVCGHLCMSACLFVCVCISICSYVGICACLHVCLCVFGCEYAFMVTVHVTHNALYVPAVEYSMCHMTHKT